MNTSDEALLSQFVLEESREAFDSLHRRHRDRVLNIVWRYCGDFQKAEEITQDTFLKVYRNAPNFRFKGKVSSWIFRIAVNEARGAFRHEHRKHSVQMKTTSFDPEETGAGPIPVEETTPLMLLEDRELELKIRRCLNSLRPKHREVLILSAAEGLSYREIAEVIGCRIGSVSSLLQRARTEFRKKYEGDANISDKCINSLIFFVFIL